MQPQQLQQTAIDGSNNNNISPSSSSSHQAQQQQSIVYSLEDDDRPQHNNNNMLSQRRAQDVSNNNNDKTNTTYRRSLSSSYTDRRSNRRRSISSSGIEDQQHLETEQPQGNNHFAIPTILHNRISRSFDALDDNKNSSTLDKEWKQSSILTCDTELIIPAPESTTDGSSDELLSNLEEGVECTSLHRDDGLITHNVNDNSLDTS